MSDSLGATYHDDPRVTVAEENLDQVLKWISSNYSYDDSEQPGHNGSGYVNEETGPGTFLLYLTEDAIDEYVTPMDANGFEGSDPMYLDEQPHTQLYEPFLETCEQDGAIIVSGNGRINTVNAYLEPPEKTKDEADVTLGMGAKHISAARMSVLDEVLFSKALSSSTGDITTFVDGKTQELIERDDFIGDWRDTENE